ncbi:MAG: flavodoxin domain-containing protein [Rhizobiaceae bacterium]
MHLVIVYASIEGQTRKIARAMSATAQSAGWKTTVYDGRDLADVDLATADRVIVAAPVHAGNYPEDLVDWAKAGAGGLNAVPSAFVSVSLSAASIFENEHKAIEEIAEAFCTETGWRPNAIHQAAGALRYTEYDFFKKIVMRMIARKEGAPEDTGTDVEYTDWAKLADFVRGFLGA